VANRIVVGVDGTDEDESAIEFAFEAANLHHAELRAVHTWTQPTPLGPGDMLPLVYDVDDVQSDESRLLAEELAGWRERFPHVKVDAQTVRGHPVRVLDDRSSDALLLVIGRHSRSRLTALLGSTAHGVLHHARCPVAVVPTTA
jgi:nucleotide-binding universal stress UspA family protein